ncbi:MAG TPA: pyridoxamine 5'-phosphate oxidase family protein [Propionibacteriaceae bacterium]|nr:pyridoxamine 5'-phosphate oxidase family protein [Propionibacteriaceae bacterium]
MPRTSSIPLPAEYGIAAETLAWPDVRSRLEQATQYWLATTRPDGRPHAVPVDGLWVDDVWYFGGSPQAIHQRNLRTNREIVVHLSDPMEAVIVEGLASWRVVASSEARRLAAASKAKYGYSPPLDVYTSGVWALEPQRVLAWTNFPRDATRFDFDLDPRTDSRG